MKNLVATIRDISKQFWCMVGSTKHIGIKLAFKINVLTRFLLFQAIHLSSGCKQTKMCNGFTPLNPEHCSNMNPFQSLQYLKTPSCILQHLKTQIKTAWINARQYIKENPSTYIQRYSFLWIILMQTFIESWVWK